MPDLLELTLTAILSLAPISVVDLEVDRPRLEHLAGAIASAVEEHPETHRPIPFRGPGAQAAAALALVAIAHHESRFDARVIDCRVLGAKEPSITAFQLHGRWAWGPYERGALCRSPRIAAERALFVLAHHGSRCSTPAGWFAGYASGNCGRPSKASKEECSRWEDLARGAGLRVSCTSARVELASL